ncbi:MAG: cupin domain-containing protein [Bryobacteraceae bacterium]|nr:cupin domain-containing protein [Bryobacteraceae bacterium]
MKRRKILPLAGLPLFPAAAAPALPKWPDVTFDPAKAKQIPDPSGDLRIYHEGPTDMLKSMTAGSLRLKPGMTPHPPHKHPEEEFMVVAEGTGWIEVEGKRTNVGPGSLMYCAGQKMHAIKNTGQTPLLFYFYKWIA